MRAVAFALLAPLAAAAVAFAAACSEHFPTPPEASGDGGTGEGGALEAEPPAIVPPESRVNASSSPVVFDPVRGGVWTANGDVGTISYVDPVARKVVQEIPVGRDVRSVALSPDGAWIAAVDRAGATVSLVDADARVVRRTIALGTHPRACVWDAADPRWLYVAEEDDGALAVVDRTLGEIAGTIPVGRLPAGLAVSATRREVYVTHRIDPDVTVVDLQHRAAAADVTLADEPFSSVKIPNGKPLGFESLALTADGLHAWVPHELLATTHPFVFNETIFPAISVINVPARVEQQTDPSSPDIAGRKNLFDAIDIIGPDGQPDVFSQFCAVAMHPNGILAWALACGSEDLLTFDVSDGIATGALRGLPCDHPAGIAIDEAPPPPDGGPPPYDGARLFVLCDQSKQLLTLDTGGGDPTKDTTLSGAPIGLVAKDPVDPQLRAGLTLFFRADSAKGAWATTGNDWMSCGACHLDGFGSTNTRLFEALTPPANPALDAEIGHVGLADNFSTAVSGAFDPHDVLVALLDQGGLAPDRSGAGRAGQVDPNAPDANAAQMARQLARVVARDLPGQPTWAQVDGSRPDPTYETYDGAWCGTCHEAEYEAWSRSVHAHARVDSMVQFCKHTEQGLAGSQYSRLCAGCHTPARARAGDYSMNPPDAGAPDGGAAPDGVTCLGCHDVTRLIHGGGNGDLVAETHDWTKDHRDWAHASLELLKQPAFCGGCHRQFVPGSGLVAIGTLDEHASGLFASTACVDCHARPVGVSGVSGVSGASEAGGTTAVHDHRFPGGNVTLGRLIGDPTLVAEQLANLAGAVRLEATRVDGGVLVTVINRGSGHAFPTGVTDIREPWVELQARDASGNVTHIGGPSSPGDLLPAGAARLGTDIAQADGGLLLDHQLSLATRTPFQLLVPSGGAQAVFVPMASTPPGTVELDAVLLYRNVRTTYYRDATGADGGAAPTVEMARVKVQP